MKYLPGGINLIRIKPGKQKTVQSSLSALIFSTAFVEAVLLIIINLVPREQDYLELMHSYNVEFVKFKQEFWSLCCDL